MRAALALARRGLGRVAPNPAVGCVLVREGVVLARARTGDGGRPHAEEVALRTVGAAARGATAYVTLEPCAHDRQGGSCAQKLAAAGIARAVLALRDPDPRTAGRGVGILAAAGIEVLEDVCTAEAQAVNAGYVLARTANRPLVTLKVAASLDGRVALASGESRWVTGPAARLRGHMERARHDAILVGIGTALADDPALTTRLPGVTHNPVRIVLDRRARLPHGARLARPGTWLVCEQAAHIPGVRVLSGSTGIRAVLGRLAKEGITRLLVEGGPTVITSFLQSGLWDRLLLFRAPSLLGADARAAIGPLALTDIASGPRVILDSREVLGADILEVYRPEPQSCAKA
ncbi:MAG: bifunctional diaminohydroxyphosphoribosylaminopyrimidine deaminase/5-amino-6-(5-phosphoribosylamino)uracil reductase RibD [Alphaproteobacteria bacterium]|jgi:diaminohydroxyphosphoribosylaminopyrimidine deaminase/5-amino-6-(5-phosphoribosylamino)uracil reductase|nr:bifunctional diaminohydroxyphosphoribosylaminopyrimidine deaminase/5-amino-6-(5-phosphoribosylamino)uracil reductase RibD [Alphaproteobacteria bacterium]